MVVPEAASPVGEYRKITGEIIRRIPDEKHYPSVATEALQTLAPKEG